MGLTVWAQDQKDKREAWNENQKLVKEFDLLQLAYQELSAQNDIKTNRITDLEEAALSVALAFSKKVRCIAELEEENVILKDLLFRWNNLDRIKERIDAMLAEGGAE
jgi:hypothetical protein